MGPGEFIIKVEFSDGTTVSLGANDELFIINRENATDGCSLDPARLALIERLQQAEKDSVS